MNKIPLNSKGAVCLFNSTYLYDTAGDEFDNAIAWMNRKVADANEVRARWRYVCVLAVGISLMATVVLIMFLAHSVQGGQCSNRRCRWSM